MIVLITGAKGMLGQDLVKTFKGETLLLPDEVELDITNKERVLNYIALHKPQWIINAAALTNVDACEEADTKALAMEVNGRGPGYLAQGAELLRCFRT